MSRNRGVPDRVQVTIAILPHIQVRRIGAEPSALTSVRSNDLLRTKRRRNLLFAISFNIASRANVGNFH